VESSNAQRSGRYADVAGTRVYLQEWGAGPTLLCLHGLGGGTHFFGALGQNLSNRVNTVAVDFPGPGLSAATSRFSFDEAARLIVELIRHDSLTAPVLLGHSMGTIVALEVVRQAPDLVRGLVLVGGLPEPRTEARARLAARIEHVRRHGMAGLGEHVAAANFARQTREERPEVAAVFARAFEMQDADAYIATAEALCRWTARPLPPLEHVRCLVITGEEDLYAPPDSVGDFVRALPPDTRFEILRGCGHLPFLEQPPAFAEIVAGFLDGVDG
jgi:pimeloyl-ACP methyl ester carboxylesterase